MLNLKCPAFLKIFITDLQYGRKLGKWEQCHVKTEGWGSLVWFFSQNNEVLPGWPLSAWTTPCWTTGGRNASQGQTAPSRWSRASSRWTEPARARWRWGQSTFVVRIAFYSIIVQFYHIFLHTCSWRLEYIPLWYKLCEQQIVFLVNCAPWASLASADSCVDDSLLVSKWTRQAINNRWEVFK